MRIGAFESTQHSKKLRSKTLLSANSFSEYNRY